jgi:hypothetical protein
LNRTKSDKLSLKEKKLYITSVSVKGNLRHQMRGIRKDAITSMSNINNRSTYANTYRSPETVYRLLAGNR